jgi:SAM-dependent methyltransferase
MAHHPHAEPVEPSSWVVRFAPLVPAGEAVLDVACGRGRHTRYFLSRGHPVAAVDRDVSGLTDLAADPRVEIVEADLEDGSPFPLRGRRFGGVVATNYLYRPLFHSLVQAVGPGGAFIYETYARGHERFGDPTNPAFHLRPGELVDVVWSRLRVIAYEDVVVQGDHPAAVQRICAVREA